MTARRKTPRLALVRPNQRPGQHPFLRETNVTGLFPPLGLAYLAAAARRAGFPAAVLDAHALGYDRRRTVQALGRLRPDVVGITSATFGWPVVTALARALRQALPQALILVGGPQLSLYPEESLAEPSLDGAVLGEGERPLLTLLRRLAAGEPLFGAAGTLLRRGDGLEAGPPPEVERDLDALPLPALDLLPLGCYRSLGLGQPFVSLVTSRGCPFRCRHCAQLYAGGVYRAHSAERVVAEVVRAVRRFGAREVVFFDETFTLGRKRVLAICEGLLRQNLGARWNIRTRVDRLDDELLAALAAAGCSSVHLGIEAGSPRVQRLMGKDLDLSGVEALLRRARALGIETRGYFMLGYPGERREEVEQTLLLSRELPLDWASFTITQPLPGTEIYAEALASGRIHGDYWRRYTLGQKTAPPPACCSEELSPAELSELLRRAYRGFYLRPAFLARKATNPRLWAELPRDLATLWELRR